MEAAPDEHRLEAAAHRHRIAAEVFFPFAAVRLRPDMDATEALLTIRLRDIGQPGESQRQLCVRWSPAIVPSQPLGLQETVITEWAALGLACAILTQYTDVWIRVVAAPGDNFDYWLTDGKWQYGLEVSGTMTEDLERRHRDKIRQLRSNPYGIDGYVITVGFAPGRAIFSFNDYSGADS